jgi:hypothetical protein
MLLVDVSKFVSSTAGRLTFCEFNKAYYAARIEGKKAGARNKSLHQWEYTTGNLLVILFRKL